MTVLYWLLKTTINALPSAALIWANKLVAFFKTSPQIALRDWRPDADSTAAALGSLVIVVLAVTVSLLPRRWLRASLAVVFMLVTFFALWKCYSYFTLLNTARMADTDAKQIQAVWENWYIGMLCCFVAAMTCALTTIWPNRGQNNDDDEAPDTETPQG